VTSSREEVRLPSTTARWPSEESTKSRNSLAVLAFGAFGAMPMPRGSTTVPSSRKVTWNSPPLLSTTG
jgi:hypothetical protein